MGKKKTLRDHASGLADSLAPHVENARDKAGPALADARDKAGPVLAEARDKSGAYLAEARDKAAPYVSDARDKAAPYLSEARDKAAPVLTEARDKAAPYVSDARDKFTSDVLPVVTAALAKVDDATGDARAETKKRGKAVAAALKGEVEAPEKKHRLRSLLILLGLGGIAVAVAKKLGGRQPTTNWQSSYTPPPAPGPPPAGGPVAGSAAGAHRAEALPDDTAASDPGEAASDDADVPHTATTPDNPVEDIDVEKK